MNPTLATGPEPTPPHASSSLSTLPGPFFGISQENHTTAERKEHMQQLQQGRIDSYVNSFEQAGLGRTGSIQDSAINTEENSLGDGGGQRNNETMNENNEPAPTDLSLLTWQENNIHHLHAVMTALCRLVPESFITSITLKANEDLKLEGVHAICQGAVDFISEIMNTDIEGRSTPLEVAQVDPRYVRFMQDRVRDLLARREKDAATIAYMHERCTSLAVQVQQLKPMERGSVGW